MKNIAQQGLSRRSFLTGAAATGALAAFGLAGCAPQGKQDATADAAEPANAAGSDAKSGALRTTGWAARPTSQRTTSRRRSRPTC